MVYLTLQETYHGSSNVLDGVEQYMKSGVFLFGHIHTFANTMPHRRFNVFSFRGYMKQWALSCSVTSVMLEFLSEFQPERNESREVLMERHITHAKYIPILFTFSQCHNIK